MDASPQGPPLRRGRSSGPPEGGPHVRQAHDESVIARAVFEIGTRRPLTASARDRVR